MSSRAGDTSDPLEGRYHCLRTRCDPSSWSRERRIPGLLAQSSSDPRSLRGKGVLRCPVVPCGEGDAQTESDWRAIRVRGLG